MKKAIIICAVAAVIVAAGITAYVKQELYYLCEE